MRHTFTLNAAGNVADMYFVVYGLTEKELSRILCPEGIFVMPLEGFCYGGSQDCNNNRVGYIFL